ncbi:hypothetical protein RRV45_11050 [Bacillus sp. DTU_2020_1000418_1_SI_GHA_SEK_038]|uniref:hypothetical protein n=1 Tax=Bacillus sp. DTU_2020_1000418_1_SI_GHA_SEK_038 TaxID=3077585 RepID=UPI0028E49E07|nr:hypothetical protein [Bacillus sp. DTU_2020_1000418_1_SI_GHA_SEK_038]WNS77491.1 hypothetical protein RRV45_11050 [Bacillus sp. DTU_2020_1000418_1_SI_GHA_SEK_038]
MNPILNKFLHKAKTSLHSATALVKERIYAVTGTSSATVVQLADFIRKHPETKIKKKELLGKIFYFYKLEKDEVRYSLECRNSYILQLDVHAGNEPVVAYRSYRDHYQLNTPIKFPKLTAE